MSQLAESLKAAAQPAPKLCAVGKVLARLKGEDRQALADALVSQISNARLSMVLRHEGFEVGRTALSDHRRGACRCEPVG